MQIAKCLVSCWYGARKFIEQLWHTFTKGWALKAVSENPRKVSSFSSVALLSAIDIVMGYVRKQRLAMQNNIFFSRLTNVRLPILKYSREVNSQVGNGHALAFVH
jgi:small basic protein